MPFVDFAEFLDLGVKEKEDAMKSGERDAKKVHHDYTIIDKKLGPDIPGKFKVPKGSYDLFEFHKAIFKGDIFVAVFIFSSLKMLEFIKVLGTKLVCKDLGNFCKTVNLVNTLG